jgi:hypothetical protein
MWPLLFYFVKHQVILLVKGNMFDVNGQTINIVGNFKIWYITTGKFWQNCQDNFIKVFRTMIIINESKLEAFQPMYSNYK